MKVSAFIRTKSDKNNTDDRVTIYFRVRDVRTRTDIKAASELTINPNHWSVERQGYRGRVTTVSEEERLALDRSVMELITLISKEFYIGASNEWLQKLIFAYHHPNAFKISDGEVVETSFVSWAKKYLEARDFNVHMASNIRGLIDKVSRFEKFTREIRKVRDYNFSIGFIEAADLENFRNYLVREHEYLTKYPHLFRKLPDRTRQNIARPRGGNTVSNILTMTRTVVRYAIANGAPNKNPFDNFKMPSMLYGTPYYLTIAERDKVHNLNLSDNPVLADYRDMFIFQCCVGCRHGDLVSFTPENIINNVLEYIPQKTRKKVGVTVRVPLNQKAREVLGRVNAGAGKPLFTQHFNFKYNDAIREMLTIAGVTRLVTVINTITRREEKRPINEIASSHLARRTFIGNLYKQVKDPNIIASMSGHVAGSKAFARYRAIDDEMKKELIDMIE